MTGARSWLALTVLAVGLVAVAALMTPRSAVNGGLGFDGVQYAQMVEDLRGGHDVPVSSLAAHRVLVPAVVAASGMEASAGFFAVAVVTSVLSLILLGVLLRDHGVSGGWLALALGSWLVLPAGVRYFLYQPVLVDASATAMLIALLVLAQRRQLLAFAVLLPFAVLVRETALTILPFVWLLERDRGPLAASLRTLAASAAGLAALWAVSAFPPVPVDPVISLPLSALINVSVVLSDQDGHAWRYIAALPLGMGLLLVLPLARLRTAAAFLVREPQWLYLAAVTLVAGVVGGVDHDRYLLPVSIVLVLLGFGPARPPIAAATAWLLLAGLHVIAAAQVRPLGTDEAAALSYFASTMGQPLLVERIGIWAASALSAGIIAFLALRSAQQPRAAAQIEAEAHSPHS